MRCRSLAMAVAIEVALRGTSLAADPRFPDWPCNQIKVPEISVAAVWAGPSIDRSDVMRWQFERMSGSTGLKVQAAIAC